MIKCTIHNKDQIVFAVNYLRHVLLSRNLTTVVRFNPRQIFYLVFIIYEALDQFLK